MIRRLAAALFLATTALAQTPPQQEVPPHDITGVDTAAPDAAIAVPIPEADRKRMQRYDIPELVGARMAIGPQLIDGELPKPILDYVARDTRIEQRLSLFEGGLVVVSISGPGASIRKKLIIPADAVKNYLKVISAEGLTKIRETDLSSPRDGRQAFLRIYRENDYVQRNFDPAAVLPKRMNDQVLPLQDLLRAIYEDRGISNTIAGYIPAIGDELVADDRKVYKVVRIIDDRVVELRCKNDPTMMYVAIKDLYNYFIGTTGAARQ